MLTMVRQRWTVALLFLFVSAIMSSLIFKSVAIICYAIALVFIISALILAADAYLREKQRRNQQ
jgi:positive regulator of sigma E activity